MARKLRRDEITHDLEALLGHGMAVADQICRPLTAAYLSLALDAFHEETRSDPATPLLDGALQVEQPNLGANPLRA